MNAACPAHHLDTIIAVKTEFGAPPQQNQRLSAFPLPHCPNAPLPHCPIATCDKFRTIYYPCGNCLRTKVTRLRPKDPDTPIYVKVIQGQP
jgi:hypothetical protein